MTDRLTTNATVSSAFENMTDLATVLTSSGSSSCNGQISTPKPRRRFAITSALQDTEKKNSAPLSAPLAHKRVGGVPITKKRLPPRSKDEILREKCIKSAQREAEKDDRQLSGKGACVKHRDRDRDQQWASRRIHQVRRFTNLFIRGDQHERLCILTEDQACEVDDLCQAAAFQATRTPHSRCLQTGSPALWTIALVQQVWSQHNNGWVTDTVEGRNRLSFQNMHNVCIRAQGDSTAMPEINPNAEMEMRKTEKQRQSGVVRKFPGHSFGSREQMEAKLSCLDDLLKASGNDGLGQDIKRMLPPAIYHRPKPPVHSMSSKCANRIANHHIFGVTNTSTSSGPPSPSSKH